MRKLEIIQTIDGRFAVAFHTQYRYNVSSPHPRPGPLPLITKTYYVYNENNEKLEKLRQTTEARLTEEKMRQNASTDIIEKLMHEFTHSGIEGYIGINADHKESAEALFYTEWKSNQFLDKIMKAHYESEETKARLKYIGKMSDQKHELNKQQFDGRLPIHSSRSLENIEDDEDVYEREPISVKTKRWWQF